MPRAALKKQDSNGVIIVERMRDYTNDPFIKKKAEKARAFIKKNGLPKSGKKKK